MFNKLFEIAKDRLANTDEKINGLPESQVTVLFTDKNNFYVAVNDIVLQGTDGFNIKKLSITMSGY